MTFGKRLQALRNSLGLSQEALAEKLNVSEADIVNFENEKTMPSVDVLIKMSGIFSISIDELLGNAPAEEKPIAKFVTNNTKRFVKNAIKDENYILNTTLLVLDVIFIYLGIALVWFLNLNFDEVNNTAIPNFVFILFYGAMFGAIVCGLTAAYVTVKILQSRRAKKYLTLLDSSTTEMQVFKYYIMLTYIKDGNTSYLKIFNNEIVKLTDSDEYLILYLANGKYFIVDKTNAEGFPDAIAQYMLINRRKIKKCRISEHTVCNYSKTYKIKLTGIVLFILSLLSLHIGLMPEALIMKNINTFNDVAATVLSGILLYFILIPLSSLIFGIHFKRKGFKVKKNIVAGIIMMCLIILYGELCMFGALIIRGIL